MGFKTLLAYLCTTIMSITVGLVLVNLVNPGSFIDQIQREKNHKSYIIFKSEGLVEDVFLADKMQTVQDHKKSGPLQFIVDIIPSNIFHSLSNNKLMLQIIFFAIFFGTTLVMIPKRHSQVLSPIVDVFNLVFLKMVDIIMSAAPFFVFCLLAGVMAKIAGDSPSGVIEIFKGLGVYSVVVILGLMIMIFIIYPAFVFLFRGTRYFSFFSAILPAQMLAFSTSSSAATLPVTMDCVEKRLGVSGRISNFVLPIGATVNMDGTSLYQAVAVVFLAQMHMIELSVSQQILIVFTATMASIGSAAVPSAGLVMLIIVLDAVGLNPAWISIIFPVDRILDMCRTVVNVTGDATVSSIVASMDEK
jgi:Na+/H+-dicarboxylate symporter